MPALPSRLALVLASALGSLALLAGCGEEAAAPVAGASSAEPSPTPSPKPSTTPASTADVVEVPADFPLADAFPATNGDDGSPVAVLDRALAGRTELCGAPLWSPTGAVDVAGAAYSGEAEDYRARTLALYPGDAEADAALDRVRATVASCPDGSVGGTDQVYAPYADSPDSVTYTHRYRTEGRFDVGLEVIEVARVGNALYLASYYGEGGGSVDTIASSVDLAHRESSGVVDAMCRFTNAGC